MINYKLFYGEKDKKPQHKWKNSEVFSNFYAEKRPLLIDGKLWLNTEQYFQANKFNHPNATKYEKEYYNIIHKADSSQKMKSIANQTKHRFGGKWMLNTGKTWIIGGSDQRLINDIIDKYKNKVKFRGDWWKIQSIYVRIRALTHKFTQYKNLYRIIVNEIGDDDYLVENTSRDKIWADGGDGGSGKIGKNYLGKILTVLHHILKYGDCRKMSRELKEKVRV